MPKAVSKKIKPSKIHSVEAGLEICRVTATMMPALAPLICSPNVSQKQLDKAMDRLINCYWDMIGKVSESFDFEPSSVE